MSELEEQLSQISPSEREVLERLSMFYEPLNYSDFTAVLRILELKTSEGKEISANYASLLRNSLINKGFLNEVRAVWGKAVEVSNSELRESLMRSAATREWFGNAAETIKVNFPVRQFSTWFHENTRLSWRLLRDFRLAVYGTHNIFSASYDELKQRGWEGEAHSLLWEIFTPLNAEFLQKFDRPSQKLILRELFKRNFEISKSNETLWEFIRENEVDENDFVRFRLDELIFKGEFAAARALAVEPLTFEKLTAAGTLALLEKNFANAAQNFEIAVGMWRKVAGKRKGFPAVWQMFLYGLALYKTDEARFFAFLNDYEAYAAKTNSLLAAPTALKCVDYFLKNNDDAAKHLFAGITSESLFARIIKIITGALVPAARLSAAETAEFGLNVQAAGFRWLELEFHNLLAAKGKRGGKATLEAAESAEKLKVELGIEPLGNLIEPLADWERALRVLTATAKNMAERSAPKTVAVNETRVAWLIDFSARIIQPIEQKFGKNGWSNGRNIALKRLFQRDVPNLSEQDGKVIKAGLKREDRYYYNDEYRFKWENAIAELIEHPLLFLQENPGVSVQLSAGEPNLIIKQTKNELEMSFDTKFDAEGLVIEKETETRYKAIKISPQHVEVAAVLQNKRLKIPDKGRGALLAAIQPLSSVISIQSDLAEHFDALPFVEADRRIHALITPRGEGYHLEFFVKPFGTIPPYFKPGKNQESVVAELDGVRTRTTRDLPAERELLNEIEKTCPTLAADENPNYEWELRDAEACLNALVELETPRGAGKLAIEWTKGQKLNLLGSVNFENFRLNVKSKNNWFEVSGEARVNEDLVLSMQEINRLLAEGGKNFIELSDGQFVAITEKLRRHLQTLGGAANDDGELHQLRAGILADFADDLTNFTADKKWREHLVKLENVKKFVPELPPTFEAELRPYQIEGFEWLSRLAKWGVGACLADDMGLGKAQPLDASILTKAGWKRMGQIKVGDEIYGSKGKLTTVLGVYPQGEKDIYKVTFSDKSSTECCAEHLWTVNTPLRNSRNYAPKTLSLQEIMDSGLRDKAGNCKWFIPIAQAVEFEKKEFYLDPYLLGVLIGDGCLIRNVKFSSIDKEIIEAVTEFLPDNYQVRHINRCDYTITRTSREKFGANFVFREIKNFGLNTRSENKHIPFAYLHASVEQRQSLLQGLLDTDGYCSKDNTVQFYTTSEQLAQDVVYLVRSLGGLARQTIKKTTHLACHVLTLALPDKVKPFRLSRKAERYQPRVKYKPSRAIVSIEFVGRKQTQCIKIAAEDSLYITDDFILTHNTVMALGALVERAEMGAALVVAPVSVCRNWIKEAARFAPTLNFHLFGADDRKSTVENLGKFDVLVTSYNLLQAEEELFTGRSFATILLDEAQAIKNRMTKRSQTVMALRGDFRVITTGTPIENHLGELWNLFNFINPGLLGNHEFFTRKFAAPIEKNRDETARRTLQKIIQPFVLRRRKNQVLEDLPAKTEIVLNVEMSAEERAFYESLRRQALENIEAADGKISDKRFRIMAELTKLRLACCHPHLVNADAPLDGGGKLDLFGEVLTELLENKHKALVFSQFVKHLHLIEKFLQARGINYHYLDGSTPSSVRQERIDAFQRGVGEVFLISLKAGGTGLNLTAADYVIHLDPWWNPAVEDQATDRVHRIGQQRPVTVYRLVTENTVEEKILKLHDTKRDLADSLLDGSDASGKLSADDLLNLIRVGGDEN